MSAAGFTEIKTFRRKMPIGGWPKDERLKNVGRYNQMACEEGLVGVFQWILLRKLSWKKEEVEVFFAKIRNALRNRQIHAYVWW